LICSWDGEKSYKVVQEVDKNDKDKEQKAVKGEL
jgi:WD40 repeat protein